MWISKAPGKLAFHSAFQHFILIILSDKIDLTSVNIPSDICIYPSHCLHYVPKNIPQKKMFPVLDCWYTFLVVNFLLLTVSVLTTVSVRCLLCRCRFLGITKQTSVSTSPNPKILSLNLSAPHFVPPLTAF